MLSRLLPLLVISAAFLLEVTADINSTRADMLINYQLVQLNFEPADIHPVHAQYEFWFNAFNRSFHLLVSPKPWKERNVLIQGSTGLSNFVSTSPMYHFVEGHFTEESGSQVYGILDLNREMQGDRFKGVIFTNSSLFFLEYPEDILPGQYDRSQALVYRDIDLRDAECKDKYCGDIVINDSEGTEHLGRIRENITMPQRRINIDFVKNKSCLVEIHADSRILAKYHNDEKKLVYQIILWMSLADGIFRQADIDSDGTSDNIGIITDKITIHKNDSDAFPDITDDKIASKYLRQCANLNSNYCLSICFTDQKWKGVLGVALRPVAKPYMFGICGRSNSTQYNNNIVALTVRGATLMKTTLTLSHELGHAFGAEHDPFSGECFERSYRGHYMMGAVLNKWSKGPNTRKFSTCSKDGILQALYQQSSCFVDVPRPFCGNLIVEEGEECDCGMADICLRIDHCCMPAGPEGCRLRSNVECSFKTDPECCRRNCKFVSANTKCGLQSVIPECHGQPLCTGNSSKCYYPGISEDGTRCGLYGDLTCSKGKCTSNVCADMKLQRCSCSKRENLCEMCCRKSSIRCVPYSQDAGEEKVTLGFGHPCDFYRGYCDRNGTCIPRDIKDYRPYEHWVIRNWSYVVNVILFIIFILLVIAVVFFYHLPSSEENPYSKQE